MPKYTMLQMVQKVARAINSDEVSALDETIEAEDIKAILVESLVDLLTRQDWEFLKNRPKTLSAGADALSLAIPADVSKVEQVRYKSISDPADADQWKTLTYMRPEVFLDRLQRIDATQPNTTTVTISGVTLAAKTNKPPKYWTTFDEDNIYFDSYDSDVDASGIDAANSVILATIYPTIDDTDGTWVAPIPEKLFPLWLEESKAEAAVRLRQFEDGRAERKARRLFISSSRDEPRTRRDDGNDEVDFGR